MVCKGTCIRYVAKKSSFGKNIRYASGQKRCSLCSVFLVWDGNRCPCCGFVLRTKPRNTTVRHRLLSSISRN